MSEQITEAEVASTPPMDDAIAKDGRTQEQLLADIISNSDFVPKEESLPEEQVPEVDPGESESEQDPTDENVDEKSEEPVKEEVEEEVETE